MNQHATPVRNTELATLAVVRAFAQRNGVKFSAAMERAVRYLERNGQRFGVEYGYILDQARALRRRNRRARTGKAAA
jgi:hypothetical protein